MVVFITVSNDLNMECAKCMVGALTNQRLLKIRGGRPLHVLPVASRIEQQAQIVRDWWSPNPSSIGGSSSDPRFRYIRDNVRKLQP